MQVFGNDDWYGFVCKNLQKYGMRFHFSEDDFSLESVTKTAPWITEEYLGEDKYWKIVCDSCGFLLFDTKEEMEHIFRQTIMDFDCNDPDFKNQIPVYAATYGPDGECLSENT